MINKFYIGVDGGGTYTRVAVVSEVGELILHECGGTINFNAVGFDTARKNFEDAFDKIISKISTDNIARVFIGCSALDTRADIETTKRLMGKYSFLKADMDSDLYVALFGHTFGEKGAMLISGTGSMGIAVSEGGKLFTCGGWGYAVGDEGSAYHIATEGLRAAVKMADGRAEVSALYYAMLDHYGIDDPHTLAEKLYQPYLSRDKIASFARVVSDCAKKGDPTALSILDLAASELAQLASALLRKSGISDSIAVYGGVLQNNGYVLSQLKKNLCREFSGIRVLFPRALPEFGAAAAAINEDGALTEECIKKICSINQKSEDQK